VNVRLALDFDGSLVLSQPAPPGFGWRPGAREFLAAAHAAGAHLILHSSRCTPMDPAPGIEEEIALWYETGAVNARITEQWRRFDEMRAFLQAEGAWQVFAEVWQSPGKPHVDRFIDDSAETPDWRALAAELGVSLPG
jgi:hypothetical protein